MEKYTFKTWLKRARPGNNPAGDLIVDLKADDSLPVIRSREALRNYLKSCNACDGALEAVPEVWKRFRKGHLIRFGDAEVGVGR